MAGIQSRQIVKRWGQVTAVNGVGFEAPAGEIFGIIGPDGAGKTTLFRILTTLLLADSGEATVDGLDVRRDYLEIRRRVGYMPGRFSLYQDLSVEENLTFFASVFGTTLRENYELVKDIYQQIEPFKARRAGALSGGMKQKLALSCALIHKPAVLFLDEPTTGVDPVSRRDLWEMLLKLKKQGLCILVSTPYMDEAALCDRIALMTDGRFLAQDTPAAITAGFHGRLLAAQGDKMPALLRDLRATPGVLSCYAFGDSHHLRVTDDLDAEALRLRLEARGHSEVVVAPVAPGIEDCFMLLAPAPGGVAVSVITAKDLTKRFGSFTAVDSITFEVQPGEIFGFLGANGAGKTTAMRILCGLSPPTSGLGTVAGYDVSKDPEKVKASIGYMSQRFALYDDLKVWENIRLYAGIYGVKAAQIPERISETLSRLQFESSRNELVRALPLGWKQKLAFSIAMVHRPRVVFLDEPTGGVDPMARRQFWELIYQAAEDGVTVFATTHYMDEAEYCNRVSILVDGRIEALDTPRELKRQYGVTTMNEVFFHLARRAQRRDG